MKTMFKGPVPTCAMLLLAAAGIAAPGAFADTVEPRKAGGDMVVGSGIDATGFVSGTNGRVSVYLKARGRPSTGFATAPILQVGDTYTVLSGANPGGPQTWWNWDYQFSPEAGDTGSVTGGSPDYGLGLFFDTNPGAGVTFGAQVLPLFDPDMLPFNATPNSWDDSDGFFLNPGAGLWTDNSINYVYSQSWRYEFLGIPQASLGAGDYDIRWAAYPDAGAMTGDNPLAVAAITVRVIPATITALTLDAVDPCLGAGENQLVVQVNLANAQAVIEGGQFFLEYDNALLDFVSADPAGAFGLQILENVDEMAGTIQYAVGVDFLNGDPGTDDAGPMATLTFNVLAEFCAEDALVSFGTGVLPTRVTNDVGANISGASLHLADLGEVSRDTTDPLLSLPANINENADAGVCTLTTDPGMATAMDSCSDVGLVTVNFSRSDMAGSLTDPYPIGTTTITWTAEDACGNSVSQDQTVTVNAANTLNVAVELQGTVDAGPFDRCITFELTPTGGGAPVVVNQTMSFSGGLAMAAVDVPCGSYECLTARDALHTLRRTDADDFMISGANYVADFTSVGGDELLGGNFNNDAFIDILDFGIFIGQFGDSVSVHTPCGTAAPHADASGNGTVDTGDFTFVQINFLEFAEDDCDGNLFRVAQGAGGLSARALAPRDEGPVTSITVAELNRRGMGGLAQADLNADGRLDEGDVFAFMAGARPDRVADLDADGVVGISDVMIALDSLSSGQGRGDVNEDGVVDQRDLRFVFDRVGWSSQD